MLDIMRTAKFHKEEVLLVLQIYFTFTPLIKVNHRFTFKSFDEKFYLPKPPSAADLLALP